MTYLLGVDEAGYGPNLGPLVVSATLWQVADLSEPVDLYQRLRASIDGGHGRRGGTNRLVMADSKLLYKGGCGLARLELSVLAVLSVLGPCPSTWKQLWTTLDPETDSDRQCLPWYRAYDAALPVATSPESVDEAADRLRQGLRLAGVSLCAIRSTTVYPQRLNQLVRQLGNKASALSQVTLRLVDRLLGLAKTGPILVACDKHGGRSRYGQLLQEQFPQYVIEIYHEGRAESLYRTGPPERRVEFRFRAKGERYLETALASMVSKYLREQSMGALNQFWQRHQPNLRPTAGYPVDARRFKRDISKAQSRLAIEDDWFWRSR